MRTISLLLTLNLLLCSGLFSQAQAPQGVNYQAVARDASGKVLGNHPISVKIILLEGVTTGTVLYEETHKLNTDAFGLFSMVIGQGSPLTGTFDAVDWSSASKFLQVSIDPDGGNDFIDMGTTQLLSVPYALYAEKSGDAVSPPPFHAGKGIAIANDSLTNTGDLDATDDLTVSSEAKGDVRGKFSELKVEKLQGAKLQIPDAIGNNAVLKWDGEQWKPGIDSIGPSFWQAREHDLIYQQGNIGIGTEEPQGKIHLHDTTGNENIILFTNNTVIDSTRASGFVIGMNNKDGYVKNRENGYLAFATNDKPALYIYPEGDVRINRSASIGNGLSVYPELRLSNTFSAVVNEGVVIRGTDNNGSTAPLRIQSNTQHMLIDGNEIDSNVDLFINHNNSNDVYMVTGGGRVGMGTFNPRSYLHIVHDAADWGGDSGLRLENKESHYGWVFYADDDGDLNLYSKTATSNATAFRGRFVYNGGAYQKMSDARLKKNVTPLENVLSQVLQLNATTYHYVDNPDTVQRSLGFIAQEVQPLFPELVGHAGDKKGFMSLEYDGFGVLAIKAIQEQQAIIKQLEHRIEMLEQQLKP